MAQSDSGIGNVTPNAELVQMAMSYSRSYMLCAAARLGIADALGDEVRSVDHAVRGQLIRPTHNAILRVIFSKRLQVLSVPRIIQLLHVLQIGCSIHNPPLLWFLQ